MSATTAMATVAVVSPLSLYFDGDGTHKVPAQKLGSYSPAVGDRVRVEIRPHGLVPIVQGKL